MLRKLFRIIFSIIGGLVGYGTFLIISMIVRLYSPNFFVELGATNTILVSVGCIIVFGFLFFLLAPLINKGSKKVATNLESELKNVSSGDLVAGTVGLVVGLIIAFLIGQIYTMFNIGFVASILSICTYLIFGYLGVFVARQKAPDVITNEVIRKSAQGFLKERKKGDAAPKILDTSVIIDGRIVEILKTGFIEGVIVIPEFVLLELQYIADSADSLKRNRGRRGLDILKKIQDDYNVEIKDTSKEKAINEIPDVDIKLLKLAKKIGGKVLTNDYNLNKVGTIQGIEILNINELANTLKPAVLPGEEMKLFLVKEGKEDKQAVAYLDDGTMIVVENGKNHIGKTVDVTVTSVLQTSAGRMIFGKPSK